MEQNNEFRASFFDNAHTPFVILDKNLIIMDVNLIALSLLQLEREFVIGKHLKDILPSIAGNDMRKAYANVIETGSPVTFEEIKIMTETREFYFSVKAFKVGDGIAMAGLNITKLVETINELEYSQYELETANRDLRKSLSELEEFSYLASHDIKAPLTNIQVLTEMLKEETNEECSGHPILEKLSDSINILTDKLKAINQIIRLKGSNNNPKKIISFEKMLGKVTESLSDEIQKSGAIIKTDFTNCPKIYIYPDHLKAILKNLLENALKYRHPERVPQITLNTEGINKRTIISVSDNGLGFNEQMGKEKILGMFKRMHTHVEGLGIGLYIVKTIAEVHGGHLEFTTKPNFGSTFKVLI